MAMISTNNLRGSNSLRNRYIAIAFAAVLIAQSQSVPASEPMPTRKKFVVPRTEFGHPDLRGVWNYSSDTPLQRPEQYKGREFLSDEEVAAERKRVEGQIEALEKGTGLEASYNQFWNDRLAKQKNHRTSLVIDPPDGRVPSLQPGVLFQQGGRAADVPGQRPVRLPIGGIGKDGPEDRGLSERCLVGLHSGPFLNPVPYNNNVQIFQTKTHAVILTEMIHDARIVPLDSRPHIDAEIVLWSGDSRGRWEGNTLVVETRNITDKLFSYHGWGNAKQLHLTERFTRIGKDRIDYRFTLDDPATFTKQWTVSLPMVRADGDLYEYACHEGNYALRNILVGARKEESDAAAAAIQPQHPAGKD